MIDKLTVTTALAGLAMLMLASSSVPSQAKGHGGFAQRHPRRAQVLGRDRNLNNRINKDAGHLGGHYGQLKKEDRGIHRQERWDKNHDDGHITKGEQHQLNHEENHVNQQIQHDHN